MGQPRRICCRARGGSLHVLALRAATALGRGDDRGLPALLDLRLYRLGLVHILITAHREGIEMALRAFPVSTRISTLIKTPPGSRGPTYRLKAHYMSAVKKLMSGTRVKKSKEYACF